MVGAQGLEPWTRGLRVSSSNLLNYLSISLCRLNACGENIMLFGNTRIFVPEDTAGKVRGVSPVDRGRCCGRGSEEMRRHIYPNRPKGCFRNQYSQVFLRELQSGSGGDPQRVAPLRRR
jgi:hypothetical protein